jgi:hypothetical protein
MANSWVRGRESGTVDMIKESTYVHLGLGSGNYDEIAMETDLTVSLDGWDSLKATLYEVDTATTETLTLDVSSNTSSLYIAVTNFRDGSPNYHMSGITISANKKAWWYGTTRVIKQWGLATSAGDSVYVKEVWLEKEDSTREYLYIEGLEFPPTIKSPLPTFFK